MSTIQCPNCRSTDILIQQRLQKPGGERAAHIGRWRIGCGMGVTLVVLAVGSLAAYLAMTLADATFRQLALAFAAICAVFVVNGLGMTIYFSRWSPTQQYICQSCETEWMGTAEVGTEQPA